MKFKKALGAILAVALVISLMPAMAFASTTNKVEKDFTVASDADMPTVAMTMEVTNQTGIVAGEVTKFKVALENATFREFGPDEDQQTIDAYTAGAAQNTASILVGSSVANAALTVDATSRSEDSMTVSIVSDRNIPKDAYFTLYLNLTSGTDGGAIKASIENVDSKITSGTYTVGLVNTSTTITKVTGKVKTYPRQNVTGATVEITETAVNSITTDQILKLTLPKGCTWTNQTMIDGDLINAVSNGTEFGSLNEMTTAKTNGWFIDGKTFYVYLDVDSDATLRENISITPNFTIGKDATMGDLSMAISTYRVYDNGDEITSESGLVIAKYGEEAVSVTTDEDDLPEIVAGYVADKNDKEFVVEVVIEENIQNALGRDRFIDFDFNDEVQILSPANDNFTNGIRYSLSTGSPSYSSARALAGSALFDFDNDVTKNLSGFSLEVPNDGELTGWSDTKANKLTLFIPVTVQADYTGDIELTVKGAKAGIEETTLVVGKAIAPISVKTEITKVVNGAQQQAVANITITENVSGYLDDNEHILLYVDSLGLLNGFVFDDATAKVTSGDMEIGKLSKNRAGMATNRAGNLWFEITDPSTKTSTIEITGITANLSRLLPVGDYNLKVTGDALLQNAAYNDGDFDTATVTTPYITITTAADTAQNYDAKFVIGSTTYTVEGVESTMDAAPYIDEHNRTLVPIRYIANALGISDANISYSNATNTATINGATSVVTVTTGNNTITTSAGNIVMDTVAVNKDGRLYVPARFIANAFNAQVAWDAATKTVTIY